MDKHLNSEETRLQSLLEEKDFNDLNGSEESFVLGILSHNDYVLQRKIIKESHSIYEDSRLVAPPLLVANGAATSFWFKKAPVYQTLLAVAATILLMFLITRPDTSIKESEVVIEYVSQVDTVFETKVMVDTLVKYVDKPVIVETIKYIEVPAKEVANSNVTYASSIEEGRVLEPSMNVRLPDFNDTKSSSSSNSFKNDPTSILVSDFVLNQ